MGGRPNSSSVTAPAKPATAKAAVGFAVRRPAASTLSLTEEAYAATTPAATSSARKPRKRLNRRTGQDPSVTFYTTKGGRRMGRLLYWTDVAGQAERVQKSFSLGDLTGLSDEAIEKKRKAAIAELGIYPPATENVPSPDSFAERAGNWLTYELPKRRRKHAASRYIVKCLLDEFSKSPSTLSRRKSLTIGSARSEIRTAPSQASKLSSISCRTSDLFSRS